MRLIRAAALCAALLAGATACGTEDPNAATGADKAAFAAAWSAQTESEKASVCLTLTLYGEHGVAERATTMERPQVFAALLAEQCAQEGR